MILSWLAGAAAAAPGVEAPIRPPIVEIDHPRYVDAAGRPVTWSEVREAARGSDAIGQVRRRRIGRTVLRVLFASATAVEGWATVQVANSERDASGRSDGWWALPLGIQTASTGLVGVLLWTNLPSQVLEDRTSIVEGANGVYGRPR